MINLLLKFFHFYEKIHKFEKQLYKSGQNMEKEIFNCQLIKLNCQFDYIGNALSNIVIDNIIKVWAQQRTVWTTD